MAFAAVIFDVDGTLIDSNELHVQAFVEVFAQYGYPIPADRIRFEIGKGGDNLVPDIIGIGADEKDGDDIRKAQPKAFAKLAEQHGLKLFPGTRELINEVRRRKLKVIIATSSGKEQIETLTKYSGFDLRKESDVMVTADDIGTSKPAPDAVSVSAQKANLSPAQCIMIGDTPWDVESAKKAGVDTIGVTTGGRPAEQLLEAGAVRVYSSPADVLAHLDEALQLALPRD